MDPVQHYLNQRAWRQWSAILEAQSEFAAGQTVLDLGCGVGDVACELSARGAKVLGVDAEPKFVAAARRRQIPGAEFHVGDLREPLPVDRPVSGLFGGFVAAYFVDLAARLGEWARVLEPGGWCLLVEIDDLFAHQPISNTSREALENYADEALAAGRYDFRMGRRLASEMEAAGFVVDRVFDVADAELAFNGAASTAVQVAWRERFERMGGMQSTLGARYPAVRDDFLSALADSRHTSSCRVVVCSGSVPTGSR